MADLLGSAPDGFFSASEAFCSFPDEIQQGMCVLALKYLHGNILNVDVDFMNIMLRDGSHFIDRRQQQAVLDALIYVFRSATKLSLDVNEFSHQLLRSSIWNKNSVETVTRFWRDKSSTFSVESASSFLNVGKLLEVQWKVGMAVSSSLCKNLNSMFVTMMLRVLDPKGEIIMKSFEMTLSDFRKFSSQIRDLANMMATV